MARQFKAFAALLLACCVGSASAAHTALIEAARLWSTAKYTHPALADGRIDWDRALVDAMPALLAAQDMPAKRDAVASLMAPLADPSLRIHTDRAPDLLRWPTDVPDVEWLPGGVALAHLHTAELDDLSRFESLRRARKVILDLRPMVPVRHRGWESALHGLLSRLIDKPLELPALRYRIATGPRPRFDSWEGMPGAFLTIEADRIVPAADAQARPLVVIVNDTEPVPKAVLALQRAGLARVVAEEGTYRSRSGPLQQVRLGDLFVEFSAGELVTRDGRVSMAADLTLAKDRSSGPDSRPVQAALALFGSRATVPRVQALAFPLRQDEPEYRDMPYPDRAWRMLAAIKLWSVMEHHFPAKRLMSSSWDEALAACLQRMERATNALEYGRAIEDMAAALDDSHVGVYSRALNLDRGKGTLGLRVDHIEGRYLVTGFTVAPQQDSHGVRIGDELLSLDGERFDVSVARLAPRIAASSAAGRIRNAIARALRGAPDSLATLEVAGADGLVRSVPMRRSVVDTERPVRSGRPALEVLAGNIAYVDLDRLERTEVDAMFEAIQRTRAVIFDMRGYPRSVTHAIAPHLNVNAATTGASSFQNLVTALPALRGAQMTFSTTFAPTSQPPYRGKVIMLINEHTQSQAEDLALNFEAATPVLFVGMPSAGANGDLRHIALPGWVYVSYSGFEVMHADGRQLQRVGIEPHVRVAPTIEGIRAGRDDVLERALVLARELQPELAESQTNAK